MSNPSVDPTSVKEASTSLLDNEWAMLGIEYAVLAGVFVLTLIVGWLLSRLLGRAATKLIDRLGLEVLAEKLGVARLLYKVGIRSGLAKLGGQATSMLVRVLTVCVALMQLKIQGLTLALTKAVAFTPTLCAALVLAAGGFWLADKLNAMVLGDGEPGSTRRFMAKLLSVCVIVMSTTMALDHIGVEMTLIHDMLLGVYGVVAAGLGVVFALSAKESMHELIAGHYGRKLLRTGDRVRLAGHTDSLEVKQLTAMHIVLSKSERKELLVPYSKLMSQNVRVAYTSGPDLSPEDELA